MKPNRRIYVYRKGRLVRADRAQPLRLRSAAGLTVHMKHGPDSGELPSEIALKGIPPKRTSFCQREQKWREYRSHKEPTDMCPDCEYETAHEAAAFQAAGVRTSDLPQGWGRTR